MKKKEAIIGVAALLAIFTVYKITKKEDETEAAFSFGENPFGMLTNGFNNLTSSVSNTLENVTTSANNLLDPIQDDVGNLFGTVSSNTSNFFNNIWDIFPFGGVGANAMENTPTDFSQYGTAENPTGYFVVSPETQDAIDAQNNGGNEDENLFTRFRKWSVGLFSGGN